MPYVNYRHRQSFHYLLVFPSWNVKPCHNYSTIRVLRILIGLCVLHAMEVESHRQCSHIHPKPHEVIHGVHLEPAHIMKKRSLDQPLRIKIYYDESVYRLDQEKFELINNTVLPEAVHYWESALYVRKTESVIRLNRKCEQNQVFLRSRDPHPYCKNSCEIVTMCGEVPVPEEHLEACRVCDVQGSNCRVSGPPPGNGIVGADFVFYISAMDTERCHKGLTVAYAAHCQQEGVLDRPIAGHANLCPGSISTKAQELEVLISTVKHEILHALGFSVSLYAFYRDDRGEPLTPRDENGKPELNEQLQARQWSSRVIRKVTRPNWRVRGGTISRTVNVVVTPRVVEEVRNHFGCPTLEGAELEDQGEDGTALTHFEKRLFENEAMTGTHTQNPVYSRITLALMEDSGWYRANMALAQPLHWGSKLGCKFATNSCMSWMEERQKGGESLHPFCNRVKKDPLETECSIDRSSVALCNLVRQQFALPPMYQNFESLPGVDPNALAYYGGSVALADYCPYIQEFTWRADNVVVRGSHCFYEDNNPKGDRNFALEKYGKHSKCFDHGSHMWEEKTCSQLRQWQHWGSGCYQYSCTRGRLHIMVENKTYPCYYRGQELKIRVYAYGWLHLGSIMCPSCDELCQEELEAKNSTCLPDMGLPKSLSYPSDRLDCGRGGQVSSNVILHVLLVAAGLFVYSRS